MITISFSLPSFSLTLSHSLRFFPTNSFSPFRFFSNHLVLSIWYFLVTKKSYEILDMGGGGGESDEDKEKLAEMERERLEALREAEDRRAAKHAKMEQEREGMRQGIRDKV